MVHTVVSSVMEVILCLFWFLSVCPLVIISQLVYLDVQPSEAEEGSRLNLVCKTDEPRWVAKWYRNNEEILTMKRPKGAVCRMQWLIPKTGVFNDTRTKCIPDSGEFHLGFLHVTKELNNTRWYCDINRQQSQHVIIKVAEKRATLAFSHAAVQLGSRLDIICEYSNPARSSTWYKDGEKVLYVYRTNGGCKVERFGTDLSDTSSTCPKDSKSSKFVLTIPEVKAELSNTVWYCCIDNNTATSSVTKQIFVLGDRGFVIEGGSGKIPEFTTESKEGSRSSATTPDLGTTAVLSIGGAAGILVTLMITTSLILIWRRMKKKGTSLRGREGDHGSTSAGPGADVLYDLPMQLVHQAQSTVASTVSKTHGPGTGYSTLHSDSHDYEHMYNVINHDVAR